MIFELGPQRGWGLKRMKRETKSVVDVHAVVGGSDRIVAAFNVMRGVARGATLVGAALVIGGCGLGSLTSGVGGGIFGGNKSAPDTSSNGVTAETMLTAAKAEGADAAGGSADLPGGCPRFSIWSRDGQVTIFETGRVGDGLAVVHRAEITKTARECRQDGNRITVKYGFSGKVLLGPRGKSGNVQLPLAVFVTDAKRERVSNEKVRIDVPVALENPIGYFSSVKEVTFTIPVGSRPGEFEVYVGFERGIPNSG